MIHSKIIRKVQEHCAKKYTYNNHNLPRVTEIISKMISEDYLLSWSNQLGFKHIPYKKIVDEACDYGSMTHKSIEEQITEGKQSKEERVIVSYNAFMKWWSKLNSSNSVEVLGSEQVIVCNLYGGTYDLLLKINGLVYLVDFKTSKHITYKYYLQLAAYKLLLETEYNKKIDGFIILQLSKVNEEYTEYVTNLNDKKQKEYVDLCEETFMKIVEAYYNVLYIEGKFNDNDNKIYILNRNNTFFK